jgi:hypothetical protein
MTDDLLQNFVIRIVRAPAMTRAKKIFASTLQNGVYFGLWIKDVDIHGRLTLVFLLFFKRFNFYTLLFHFPQEWVKTDGQPRALTLMLYE